MSDPAVQESQPETSEQLDLFNLSDVDGDNTDAGVEKPPAVESAPAESSSEAIISPDLVDAVAKRVSEVLQPQIEQTLAVQRANEEVRQEFYNANPDLVGRDLVVGAITEKFIQENPSATKEDAFKTIAQASREYLAGPKVTEQIKHETQLQQTSSSPAPAVELNDSVSSLVDYANSELRF